MALFAQNNKQQVPTCFISLPDSIPKFQKPKSPNAQTPNFPNSDFTPLHSLTFRVSTVLLDSLIRCNGLGLTYWSGIVRIGIGIGMVIVIFIGIAFVSAPILFCKASAAIADITSRDPAAVVMAFQVGAISVLLSAANHHSEDAPVLIAVSGALEVRS